MDWQSQSDEDMRATDYMLLQNRESVQGVIVIVFEEIHLSLMCESITTASTPPSPPRTNSGHMFHDESRGTGI